MNIGRMVQKYKFTRASSSVNFNVVTDYCRNIGHLVTAAYIDSDNIMTSYHPT